VVGAAATAVGDSVDDGGVVGVVISCSIDL